MHIWWTFNKSHLDCSVNRTKMLVFGGKRNTFHHVGNLNRYYGATREVGIRRATS